MATETEKLTPELYFMSLFLFKKPHVATVLSVTLLVSLGRKTSQAKGTECARMQNIPTMPSEVVSEAVQCTGQL